MSLLTKLSLSREPSYFAVDRCLVIPTAKIGLSSSSLGKEVVLVRLSICALADPNSDVIGVCGDGKGNLRFFWHDRVWHRVDINSILYGHATIRSHLLVNPIDSDVTPREWQLLY